MTFTPETLEIIAKRQDEIDSLSKEMREVVYEFGWGIVHPLIRAGINKPGQARHIIQTILKGSYETQERFNATRRISLAGERMNEATRSLGLNCNGQAVVEAYRRFGGLCLSMTPTRPMIEASMSALDRRPPKVWKTEDKHRVRLHDALKAAEKTEHGE